MNIVDQEESDTIQLNCNGQSDEDRVLMQNQTKPQYARHFNHKIKLLKLLDQYTRGVINALSYYCDICDFMAEEKHTWNNHNETEHPDINKSLHFCTICSMLILSNNFEEHYSTPEHCDLFEYIQSLCSVREGLIKNTSLVSTVKSCPSNETFIKENKNKQNKSNNIDIGEGN